MISERSVREMHALQHSIPIQKTPPDNPYAARFYGTGLGWMTFDYRGRKLVMHTGAWGAIIGMVPEENLGVVVLTNLDWDYGFTITTMYRVLDAYCAESESNWRTDNLNQPYIEAPGQAYRVRDRERSTLEASRIKGTMPSVPLAGFGGDYRSPFYGDINISNEDGQLRLLIGPFETRLKHWEHDLFYAKAPTRMNYDWLVQFDVNGDGADGLTLKYVGWKEPDVRFLRRAKGD